MAEAKKGGSIIFKILIVIFLGGLLISIYYPKHIWDTEAKEEKECRSRLMNLWTIETFFKQKTGKFSSSLDSLINTLKTDKNIMAVLDTIYTHSLFNEKETLNVIYPIPIDSLKLCPSTGLEYHIILSDSIPAVIIKCPNMEEIKPVYVFFKKKISNHGSISDGKVSWE
jgi:hypothetical protein